MNKSFWLLVILIILTICLAFFHYYFLDLKQLEINAAKENLSLLQIKKIISNYDNLNYTVFAKITINTLITIISVSFILFFGSFIFNFKNNYIDLLIITIKAEYLFLLPILYEIIYFKFFSVNHSIKDIQYFMALSAINFTGYKGLEPWYIYPLQTLNLFEVAYILYLGFEIAKLTKSAPSEGLKIVVLSYVPALLLWVCTIMFLTLNKS